MQESVTPAPVPDHTSKSEHTSPAMDIWVREVHNGISETSFKIKRTLFSGRSPFQQIDIVETWGLGRMLLNDGLFMVAERDEFVYHEMIAHVPLLVHPAPRRVLVIGGGDGGTVREILKHPDVLEVVLVEIDALVVEACRRHLPSVAAGLDDSRVAICIEDGTCFVAREQAPFDVIIVDSTDPIGPAEPLFNREFYRQAARMLTDDGILITQAESPFYDQHLQRPMLTRQRPFFKYLFMYLLSNLIYPGGLWSLGFGSKRLHPLKDFDPQRFLTSGISTRYYNPGIHQAAFMLPTFVRKELNGVLDDIGLQDCFKEKAK